jgi:hypothetical protein
VPVGGGLGFGVVGGPGVRPEPPGWPVRTTTAAVEATARLPASADARRRGVARRGRAFAGLSRADGCVGPKVIWGSGATCSAGTATVAGEDGSRTARQR